MLEKPDRATDQSTGCHREDTLYSSNLNLNDGAGHTDTRNYAVYRILI